MVFEIYVFLSRYTLVYRTRNFHYNISLHYFEHQLNHFFFIYISNFLSLFYILRVTMQYKHHVRCQCIDEQWADIEIYWMMINLIYITGRITANYISSSSVLYSSTLLYKPSLLIFYVSVNQWTYICGYPIVLLRLRTMWNFFFENLRESFLLNISGGATFCPEELFIIFSCSWTSQTP